MMHGILTRNRSSGRRNSPQALAAAAALVGALLLGGCGPVSEREHFPYRPIQDANTVDVFIDENSEIRAVDGEKVMIGHEYWKVEALTRFIYGSPKRRRANQKRNTSWVLYFAANRYSYRDLQLVPGRHRLEVADVDFRFDDRTKRFTVHYWNWSIPLDVRILDGGKSWRYHVDTIVQKVAGDDGLAVAIVTRQRWDAVREKAFSEVVACNLTAIVGMGEGDARRYFEAVVENRRTGDVSAAQLTKMRAEFLAANRKDIRRAGWGPHP